MQRQILGEIGVMTILALAVGVLVASSSRCSNIIYFVEPHVYLIGLRPCRWRRSICVTLLCGWYPSRVATRIEPAEALRYE